MRRLFNRREKRALLRASGGQCEICGTALTKGWHADHLIPYSAGGPTDVLNGQALCAQCNITKADKDMTHVTPWPNLELRTWQQSAFTQWRRSDSKAFLVEATPGAGKTILAARVAHDFLEGGGRRIVVVVPSDSLRRQWADEFTPFGIHLDWECNGSYVPSRDFHGVVQTYATVANNAQDFRWLSGDNSLVILDEIHHAGDALSWGRGLVTAFGHDGTRILCLSGTPFRSDNNPIPFVRYAEPDSAGEQRSIADFTYGYADALREGVVRPIVFPTYEGEVAWMDEFGTRTTNFSISLTRDDASKRLHTAIDASENNHMIRSMISDAHAKLREVRQEGHPRAGGLVVCKTQGHARRIADIVADVTGTKPDVVTSDEPESKDIIDRFRDSSKEWIVAVKMVSEGVDIKRLRIGVYLSNIKAELFLRQVIGRVIRVEEGIEDQTAYFFFPQDEEFLGVINSLQEQRDHVIWPDDDSEEFDPESSGDGSAETMIDVPVFVPVSAEATGQNWLFNEDRFTESEINYARQCKERLGMPIDEVRIAALIRYDRSNQGTATPTPSSTASTVKGPSVKTQQVTIRTQIHRRLTRNLARPVLNDRDMLLELRHYNNKLSLTSPEIAHVISALWVYCKKQFGQGKELEAMELEELTPMLQWVNEKVRRYES